MLVAQDQLARARLALVFGEALLQVFNVAREHLQGDALFRGVDGHGSDSQCGHGGNVAGFTALGLDDEDASP